MRVKARLLIKTRGPLLVPQHPLSDRVATKADPISGLPMVPSGLLWRTIKARVSELQGLIPSIGPAAEGILAGRLWIGDAIAGGSGIKDEPGSPGGQLFHRDLYWAFTQEVELFWKGKRSRAVVIRPGVELVAPIYWMQGPSPQEVAALSMIVKSIVVLGVKASDGFGLVEASLNPGMNLKKALATLGGENAS